MVAAQVNLGTLVDEYTTVLHESATDGATSDDVPWDAIRDHLVTTCDWTPLAAQHIVGLVSDYGAFVLRNAAALAIALDFEDGALAL